MYKTYADVINKSDSSMGKLHFPLACFEGKQLHSVAFWATLAKTVTEYGGPTGTEIHFVYISKYYSVFFSNFV
jgi:hypothetical protein